MVVKTAIEHGGGRLVSMAFGLTPPLALPAGTAVARLADDDGPLAGLEALEPAALAAAAVALVSQGLFAAAPAGIVVIRASKDGLSRFALLCGGMKPEIRCLEDETLLGLLKAEGRQRPFFHGTTRSGTTYSGFLAADPDAILARLNGGAPADEGGELCAVFAGEPWRLPKAIAVPLPPPC